MNRRFSIADESVPSNRINNLAETFIAERAADSYQSQPPFCLPLVCD
jgi:hypothetical protein